MGDARRGARGGTRTRTAAAAPLVLDLPSLDSTDVRLVVDEGDNQPLPLEPPALEVRTWRLRFVRGTGAELWLVYGRRDLGAPRYDLALLRDQLKDAAASEVTAEPESAPARMPASIARRRCSGSSWCLPWSPWWRWWSGC